MRKDELYIKNAKKIQWKEDGTFIAHAPITSIGVYVYSRENGTAHELRSYEEVFKEDSLKTLENLPITLHHPSDKITKENQKKHEVGRIIGNIAHYDNDPRVYADLHITNKTAIKAALSSGVKFLSCGYESKDLKIDGVFLGMKYDTIQTNIRYNHVALCRKPRGDENLMIKLDGIEEALKFGDAQTEFEETVSTINNGENNMTQKEDSGNSNAETIKMFADMQTKLDGKEKELIAAKAETDKFKGEKDVLQAKCDSLASELKSLQDSFPSQIHELACKLSTLRCLVNEWGIEGLKADATEKEMKVAIISKHDKNFKADGKSEDYISARFDSTIEIATAEKKKTADIEASKKMDGVENPASKKDGIEKKRDPEEARKKMIASYGKKEGA
jgi:hypothetical protein